jgi:Putative F0F1-ATPase subunit Ca2+/Mg2+ transporter
MNRRKDDKRRSFQQLNLILSVGMIFPVSIVIGYGIGYLLDKWLGTSSLKIVFLLFGIAAGFISFFRMISQIGNDVLAGAALSYVNFRWLKQAVDFIVLQGAEGNTGRRVLLRFLGRYALIALSLYVTIRSSALDLVFIFAGLLVYIVAILIECISEVGRVLIRDYRNGRTTGNS